MRIVGGSARGKKLIPFSGQNIRPTSDRIREAVFSSLFSRMGPFQGRGVLDLFAGTGALGIEALSRGASCATFVDNNAQAIQIIRKNLVNCGFLEKARIIHNNVFESWQQLLEGAPFDIIFLDPPYGQGLVEKTLKKISDTNCLSQEGILCVETSAKEIIVEDFYPLLQLKKSRYGSTQIYLFQVSNEGGTK